MSSHNVDEANLGTALLVPHTAYNKRGDKLHRSSRTSFAPLPAIIPVEEPKRKKRKYHPELVDSSPLFLSRPKALPSQSQRPSQQRREFTQAPETEWDDRIYVGANDHPLFNISALPADSDDAPRRKVSFLFGSFIQAEWVLI
jgi:hypothetical protein